MAQGGLKMAWIALIGMGAVIGVVLRILTLALPLRWEIIVALSIVGALLGGLLQTITQATLFGPYSFYFLGALMAVLIGGGEFLPYALTRREKRV